MTAAHTTAPIESRFRTAEELEGFLPVTLAEDGTFTVSFDDVESALKAVAKAKDAAWRTYLRNGGNPRNKRAVGAQWAGVTKAITKAAAQ